MLPENPPEHQKLVPATQLTVNYSQSHSNLKLNIRHHHRHKDRDRKHQLSSYLPMEKFTKIYLGKVILKIYWLDNTVWSSRVLLSSRRRKIHSIFLFSFIRHQLFMLWSYSVSDTNYSFLGKIWRKAFNYSFTFHICINKHKKFESRNHWDSWDINSLAGGGGGGDTKWTVTIWISKLWEISTQHSTAPSEWQHDLIR